MLVITKHTDQPLSYLIELEESLNSSYQLVNVEFIPNVMENSAQIILNLEIDSNTPSVFQHSFIQTFNGFNGDENITILISMKTADGQVVTHQESGTHIRRPLQNFNM